MLKWFRNIDEDRQKLLDRLTMLDKTVTKLTVQAELDAERIHRQKKLIETLCNAHYKTRKEYRNATLQHPKD